MEKWSYSVRPDTSGFHVYEIVGPLGIYARFGDRRYPEKCNINEAISRALDFAKSDGESIIYDSVNNVYVERK